VDAIEGAMSPAQMVTTMVGLLRARRHPAAVDRAARQRALEVTAFAGRAVPFYRDLYGGRSFTALEEVPFAEKEAMRRVPLTDRLAGPVPPGSRTLHTGGTTGAAFQTVFSPRFGRWQALLRTRTELERGWLRPWRRRATLSFGGQDRPRSGLASTAVFGRYCHLALEAPAAELAAAVVACRPAVLSGHPHRLLDVGLLLPRGARPRIATHGETLEPSLLAALTDVYGVRPLDWYGTAEVGALASQCRRADLYHVQNDSVVVEVLDPGGEPVPPGGTGDMVVTGLHNALMPMVRYRQRDRVTLADRPCACGYAGPCLAAVVGRSSDFAVGAGRERIGPVRPPIPGAAGRVR